MRNFAKGFLYLISLGLGAALAAVITMYFFKSTSQYVFGVVMIPSYVAVFFLINSVFGPPEDNAATGPWAGGGW